MTPEDPSSGSETPTPSPVEDDLDGYETSMARFSRRIRSWLVVLVAAALVVPLGGWLVDELAYRRSGDRVTDALGDEASLAEAVLLVRSVGCDGRVSTGSGFLTVLDGQPVVVTNRHVVADARTVGVRPLAGGPATAVTGYRIADDADVAVLELDEAPEEAVTLLLGGTPDVGDDVRLLGFPAARPFTTAGTVTEVGGGQLLLELEVDPGASGSPVVDEEGTVVGQVFARTHDGDGVATAGDALREAVTTATPAAAC